MKHVFQTEFGPTGNCMSACLASIFELDISEVPNFFVVGGGEAENWWSACRSWLRERGFGVMSCSIDPKVLSFYEGVFIVAGKSPRGIEHAVVFKDGQIIHDPHPEGTGVEEITAVDLLYPLDPSKLKYEI